MMYDEIQHSAGIIYHAPEGTPIPDLAVASPPSPWVRLGSGHTTADGVNILLDQSIEQVRNIKVTLPTDAERTEEDIVISARLLDASADVLARAVSFGPAAPGADYDAVVLHRGRAVTRRALLVRAYDDAHPGKWHTYHFPTVYASGRPRVERGDNVYEVPVQFTALYNADMAPTYRAPK